MGPIKVSVIIPVYNTAAYIEAALKSIVSQKLQNIEIIVINDGSTDNSLEVLQSIANSDSRICVYSQKNKGLSESRNFGIEVAKGEYIYFMDSDDILSTDALSSCYQKCKEKTLDFVFFDAKIFGHTQSNVVINYQRTHLFKEGVYKGTEILAQLLSKEVFLSSACLNFINLEFLRRIRLKFHPGILHEDELFTLLLFLQAKRVSFIPKAYFQRRIRDNSIMTSRFARKNVTGYFTVINELIKFHKEASNSLSKTLIEKRLERMIQGILYKTRSMRLQDRIYVVSHCIINLSKYTALKDLGLAFLPLSTFKKKDNRKPLRPSRDE